MPIVELYGNNKQIVPDIRCDEDQITKEVVEHLASLGFKNFAFFAIGNTCWSQFRIEAFQREVASRDGNIHIFPYAGKGPRIFYPVWEMKYTKIVQRWLERLPKPIAIWSLSDTLAIRLLEGCRRAGIHVPEEVAIIGTLNDPVLCSVMTPALSSIDLNSPQMGYVAAMRLDKKMNGIIPEPAPVIVAPTGVVPRQSTNIVAIPDKVVAEVVRIIRQNASGNITVEQISNIVDISRSSLQRRFRKYIGRTIEKEILHTRMERAKLLLRETRLSLPTIAYRVGFSSSDYFIQAFRRETGMTPNSYRKQALFQPDDDVDLF